MNLTTKQTTDVERAIYHMLGYRINIYDPRLEEKPVDTEPESEYDVPIDEEPEEEPKQ